MTKLLISVSVLFFAVIFFASISVSEAAPISTKKLNEEFLGLRFGCSYKEFQDVIQKSPNSIALVQEFTEDGARSYVYTGNHRLNDATGTIFKFFDDKLTSIYVVYKSNDASEIYNALKMKLKSKYGSSKEDIIFAGKRCRFIKGLLGVQLEYEKEYSGPDSTTVFAGHFGLIAEQGEKKTKEKGKTLGDF